MQFRRGAHIHGADDRPIGRITHVVLDPDSKIVTHVVVRRGLVFREDKLIPFAWLHSLISGRVELDDSAGDLRALPDFEESYFAAVEMPEETRDEMLVGGGEDNVRVNLPVYYSSEYPYEIRQASVPKHRYVMRRRQNIPEDAIALALGAHLICVDEAHAGQIESVVVDAETAQMTHLLAMKQMWSASRKLIPVDRIDLIGDDEVYLNVSANALQDYAERS